MNHKKDHFNLAALLRNLPEEDLPRDLTPLVMESLQPKTVSMWRRLYLLVRTPRMVNITPYRLAGAVAACVLIIALVFQLPLKRFETAVQQSEAELVPVSFSLDNKAARSVDVIGSFNNWKPEGYEMKLDRRTRRWTLHLRIPPGSYEYAFLIDNQQAIPDPQAAFYKMDGFGSRNSVIYTAANDENVL